jgi:peptidoglycan hydrolase-like protein with peptidoglycan-binding domain
MSQRDLVAELRAARIEAPSEVRARVRLIAAADTTPARRRTFTWRRALVVAIPVAAAVAATIVFTRPSHQTQAVPPVERAIAHGSVHALAPTLKSAGSTFAAPAPAPSTTRVQRYGAYLALRVPTPNGVSTGVKQALQITKSLGGYAGSVHASTTAKSGSADLKLKIPRTHVQEAIARLSAIGTITAEEVDVQDLQATVNATGRTIAQLQRQLTALRAQPQTPSTTTRIAALVRRIQGLQRANATTIRTARYATVSLHLGTAAPKPAKAHHGPLHGLAVAFRWIGIGAVYALALGAPFLLVLWLGWIATRTVRRRREDALLSRS